MSSDNKEKPKKKKGCPPKNKEQAKKRGRPAKDKEQAEAKQEETKIEENKEQVRELVVAKTHYPWQVKPQQPTIKRFAKIGVIKDKKGREFPRYRQLHTEHIPPKLRTAYRYFQKALIRYIKGLGGELEYELKKAVDFEMSNVYKVAFGG